MALPPLLDGAVHCNVICSLATVPCKLVGMPGTDAGGAVAQFAPVYESEHIQEHVALFDPEYVPDGEP